jgi:hypothetical protein
MPDTPAVSNKEWPWPPLNWPFPVKEKPVVRETTPNGNFYKDDVLDSLAFVPDVPASWNKSEYVTNDYFKNSLLGETDPNGKSLNTMGAKADAGKDRVWLCLSGFSNAMAEVAKVTTFGANKYTPNGWTEVPDATNRYMDAFGRHMMKLGAGETIDKDSGCKHLAQMIWNLMAVLELEERESTTR